LFFFECILKEFVNEGGFCSMAIGSLELKPLKSDPRRVHVHLENVNEQQQLLESHQKHLTALETVESGVVDQVLSQTGHQHISDAEAAANTLSLSHITSISFW
jgi:hypothetical protein